MNKPKDVLETGYRLIS